ncbi:MAG: hypothetical protein ACPGJV_04180 [Bacteriovoracaceae bacterium]
MRILLVFIFLIHSDCFASALGSVKKAAEKVFEKTKEIAEKTSDTLNQSQQMKKKDRFFCAWNSFSC